MRRASCARAGRAAAARMMMPSFRVSRQVWLFGWISFFTDAASEIIYPLLPIFLTRVLGAGAVSIGIIEGAAEAANSALRVGSGWLADRTRRRRPLVIGGYVLSAAARPLIGLASSWTHVFALRLTDRLGKGIRSAPRDALLVALAPPAERGRVFGLTRAMDHAGAIAGPLLAALFLWFWPGDYRTLFLLSVIPGLVVAVLVTRVREEPPLPVAPAGRESVAPAFRRGLPPAGPMRRYLFVLLLFGLGNSTDAFLLLRLSTLGVRDAFIPILWSLLHVVKATASLAGGPLSDRMGRRQMIAAGWVVYALVYAGFGAFDSREAVVALFVLYGVYFGLTEAAERALVADLAPSDARGTAFGWYYAVTGLSALAASVAFGALWHVFGAAAAFFAGAALAIAAAALIFTIPRGILGDSHDSNSRHQ